MKDSPRGESVRIYDENNVHALMILSPQTIKGPTDLVKWLGKRRLFSLGKNGSYKFFERGKSLKLQRIAFCI